MSTSRIKPHKELILHARDLKMTYSEIQEELIGKFNIWYSEAGLRTMVSRWKKEIQLETL